jgi:hypothetical protein
MSMMAGWIDGLRAATAVVCRQELMGSGDVLIWCCFVCLQAAASELLLWSLLAGQ